MFSFEILLYTFDIFIVFLYFQNVFKVQGFSSSHTQLYRI